jgi:hypothetical protein
MVLERPVFWPKFCGLVFSPPFPSPISTGRGARLAFMCIGGLYCVLGNCAVNRGD